MRVSVPINYNNTKYYTITCKHENITDCYVGHTIDFNNRKHVHKNHCKNKKSKLYNCINDNGGWDNWEMKQIESISLKTKQDVLSRERFWCEKLKATLNTNVPSRTQKERQRINKEKINKYMREYNKKKKANPIEKAIEYKKINIKDKTINILNQFIRKHLIVSCLIK